MTTYTSKRQRIAHPIQTIYDKLTSPTVFERLAHSQSEHLEHLPDDVRNQLNNIHFGPDGISMDTPVGPVRLAVDTRQSIAPTTVVYNVAESPIEFSVVINLTDNGDSTTDCEATLNINLPFFLRAMVGKQLEEGAERFGVLLAALPWDNL